METGPSGHERGCRNIDGAGGGKPGLPMATIKPALEGRAVNGSDSGTLGEGGCVNASVRETRGRGEQRKE